MVMINFDRVFRALAILRANFSVFGKKSALTGSSACLKEGFAAHATEQQACINQLGSAQTATTLQAAIEQPKNETVFSAVINRLSRRVSSINPITFTGAV